MEKKSVGAPPASSCVPVSCPCLLLCLFVSLSVPVSAGTDNSTSYLAPDLNSFMMDSRSFCGMSPCMEDTVKLASLIFSVSQSTWNNKHTQNTFPTRLCCCNYTHNPVPSNWFQISASSVLVQVYGVSPVRSVGGVMVHVVFIPDYHQDGPIKNLCHR